MDVQRDKVIPTGIARGAVLLRPDYERAASGPAKITPICVIA